jgi:PBP1b-binding outer membrane lipoprotein LpoB
MTDMRKVTVIVGLALLCLITSCSSAAGPAASPTPARNAQLTTVQAMRSFRAFLPRLASAQSNYSTGQITGLTTGAQTR